MSPESGLLGHAIAQALIRHNICGTCATTPFYLGMRMAQTGSDFLPQQLQACGVKRIVGYPGDGMFCIMGALGTLAGKVQTRHEEICAFMAHAHAKLSGELGVCPATSGPGAIHLLNGLYDAKIDHQPVCAIVAQLARSVLGGPYQQ
jgi:pyruvate dehydrogenase (quinone)